MAWRPGADPTDVEAQLLADGAPVGSAEDADILVVGQVGFAYQEVRLAFALDRAVAQGAMLELDLRIVANESYFVGYEATRASRLVLAPAT